jgi:hypothetical protein
MGMWKTSGEQDKNRECAKCIATFKQMDDESECETTLYYGVCSTERVIS